MLPWFLSDGSNDQFLGSAPSLEAKPKKELPMNKTSLMLVAVVTSAASISVPAEARGLRTLGPAAAIAAVAAAAIAADSYRYGYHVPGPRVVYYGAPRFHYGHHHHYYWHHGW
jgi:hypothetical protein